ncbi:MFS transporter [Actinocatenispora sera]|uniref:MFS transporter n=1 Tax=Actinocatenispora sera TaxID=390989 RepID=UPI0033D16E0A
MLRTGIRRIPAMLRTGIGRCPAMLRTGVGRIPVMLRDGIGRYAAAIHVAGAVRYYAASLPIRLGAAMLSLGVLVLIRHATGGYATAGAVVGTLAVAGAVGAPLTARITDRYGPRRVLPALTAGKTLGVLGLVAAVTAAAPVPLWYAAAVVAGLCTPAAGSLTRARWSALAPDRAVLSTGFALESLTDDLTFVVGPVLATVLGSLVQPVLAPLLAALLVLVGGIAMATQRRPAPALRRPDSAVPGEPSTASRAHEPATPPAAGDTPAATDAGPAPTTPRAGESSVPAAAREPQSTASAREARATGSPRKAWATGSPREARATASARPAAGEARVPPSVAENARPAAASAGGPGAARRRTLRRGAARALALRVRTGALAAPALRVIAGPLAAPALRVMAGAFVATGVVFSGVQVSIAAVASGYGQAAAAGPVYGCFGVASMCAGLGYGAIRARSAPHRRVAVGFGCLAAGCALLPFAPGLGLLAAAVAVPGLAVAPTVIAGNTVVQQRVGTRHLAEAFAWLGGACSLGVAVGAAAAGRLVDAYGPRAGFLLPILAAAAAATLVARCARTLAPADPRPDEP